MPRSARTAAGRLVALLLLALLAGCDHLPSLEERTESSALPFEEARQTPLGRAIAAVADRHPGHSGFATLTNSRGALAARPRLIRAAEKTLDVR